MSFLPSAKVCTIFAQLERTFRILIVDDDIVHANMLAELFAEAHLFCSEKAFCAQAAIAHWESKRNAFDVCLLDLYLPRLEQSMDVLRRVVPSIPVIAMSACATGAEGAAAVRGGAIDVIDKPIRDVSAMYRQVARCALRRRLVAFTKGDHFLELSVAHLIKASPSSVSGWAVGCGRDESVLREHWRLAGRRARDVLQYWNTYDTAIRCLFPSGESASITDLRSAAKHAQYYETHASAYRIHGK